MKLAVAVVILLDDRSTLLVKRGPGRTAAGYWTPVTGKVEPGESLAEAGAREVAEETGLRVIVGDEIYRCPTEGAAFELVWYVARLAPGQDPQALTLSDEIAEARWVPFAEARALRPMFPATEELYGSPAAETW